MAHLLGLDIGFGDVKGVFGDKSSQRLKFPTAVCYSKNGIGDLGEFTSGHEEYVFSGKKYLLGEHALIGAFSTKSMDFLRKYAPLFAYKAARETGKHVSHIAVGLPIAYYDEKNKFLLKNRLRRLEVNGEACEFYVSIYPQGMGILADYRFGFDGTEIHGTNLDGLVLDIGFNTLDVLAFENGSAVKADMGTLERGGISVITQELAQKLQSETTINLSEQEAKDVLLKGSLTVYGYEKDVTELIRSLVEDYVEWLLAYISSRWEERIKRADKLILAGGGAYYLKGYIPEKYQRLIHVPEEPEYSNARGFYKILGVQHQRPDTRP